MNLYEAKTALSKLVLSGEEILIARAGRPLTKVVPLTQTRAGTIQAVGRYHPDPFDRMLIAQCRTEHLMLVTHDRLFEPRPVLNLRI